ncbi:MAG TPA: lipocalin-like domain-containing protein [Holophagaceae bacterium]|nr:lipocalin-like domain-containing protein [Holophagaceae bacterium]
MKHLLLASLALLQVPERTQDGFLVARPGKVFQFPKDHGSHPGFRTEWWYWTGHLKDGQGGSYGFQLTFFRQASPAAAWKGSEAWRSDQIHLAHAALTDIGAGTFQTEERLDRGGVMAGAAASGIQVFHGSWSATEGHLRFQVRGRSLELSVKALTPPVVFGEDGVSRKGEDPTAASHYVTFPRLQVAGQLRGPHGERAVTGLAWMDHEWSSNQLDRNQVGWDWAGIQLSDGRSLMAYRLRRSDGSSDPWSSATLVDPGGRILARTRTFRMASGALWRSPRSGAEYPLPLKVEAFGETWTLEPLVQDQELGADRPGGITYWEGACRVRDAQGIDRGRAYLELTGYAHSLKGRF